LGIVFTSGELHARNGGTNIYNLCVKLLREHGYDACIATVDGAYEPWLVDQQPVVSYAQVRKMEAPKVVTGWLMTPGLEDFNAPIYYFDAELKWTMHFRSMLDHLLKTGRLAGIATHNRYIQAWYMATYEIKPPLIHQWVDFDVFYPDERMRALGTIGCMPDDPGSRETHELLRATYGDRVTIVRGNEQQVADQMRAVDIFAGLNPGKHPLWGEGFATTQQEAMASGCAVVAFDVCGNREYLWDGYTGRMVEYGNYDALVATIDELTADLGARDLLRRNGVAVMRQAFSSRGKIELLERWLNL